MRVLSEQPHRSWITKKAIRVVLGDPEMIELSKKLVSAGLLSLH
jgi:hypothetical protein